MSRSLVEYVGSAGLINNAASVGSTLSTEAVTGLPIGTGTNVGTWFELSDGQALEYSSLVVVGAQIATTGSGQTNGPYVATASNGATINYTVAGNVVTAVTVASPGIRTTTAPTVLLAANGGTAGTVNLTWGKLYAGIYAFAQLDPAVTGSALVVGSALYWLQTSAAFQVTNVIAANAPDFAGVVIDPAFSPALPYAFIQMGPGKYTALFGALTNNGTIAYGDVVGLKQATGTYTTNFDDLEALGATTAESPNSIVGFSLGVPVANGTSLIRITRTQSRF